ncbi:MAG: hypothetical protein BWY70_00242 [Bacteroidetes bacterium ADurb.Bin408]|nr:MAG: hypothetical protein BWY70_00242 [Bacteroidetes bacterium ADurb.Bin408]
MNNKDFSERMEIRTKQFAISIISLSASLIISTESNVIKNQITKSATSIGANYREANMASSIADFTYRIKICEKEANETLFWLEIIDELHWAEIEKIRTIYKEAKEILAIYTSIGKKLKL